ncbi:CDF family Co(II)/Ni(II) efflux transporter DmeF [Shewanella sp. VB17]|uniref:CDF family Co(II)/Ni(II) efflux transporter DmeF n=1 Tax=Shewanella sp. VB17 TaxID=2739432 RepID=UPI00156783F4|nr:CDF family Co(II)/Ni(II) efflux transporter DmeF [Shewanella sp. VB17]NRD71702.1 CDF family Co(II)/Ni(II) efflux transporter DmeF [Shewanella sp. VB17]
MHLSPEHNHDFCAKQSSGEKRTLYVLILTLTAMVVEIVSGTIFGSMALLADGWHMGTHAAAFCITLFAYRYARKHAHSDKFSFGTGKVSVLGGYTSAIVLGVVALLMMVESINRLFSPLTIQFNEAIMVAFLGLAVNVVSIFLLGDHHHGHAHSHDHTDDHSHSKNHSHSESHTPHDHNLRAAYMHVLADALTSVLAIVALVFGKFYGWHWLDAVMGMVGAVVIIKWTWGLMKQTSPVLLDENIDQSYRHSIKEALSPYAQVQDIHIWKISGDHYCAAIALASDNDKTVAEYKILLAKFDKIHHLTLELNPLS